jgi:hypothetical protein
MRTLWIAGTALALAAGAAMAQSNDALVKQALSPLPAELRGQATVVTYDAKGNPQILRWGQNEIYCMPPQAGAENFSASCFGPVIKAQRDFEAREKAAGKDAKTISADVEAARKARKLPTPNLGTAIYIRSGKTEADAKNLWVVLMPNAKAEDLGLPTEKGNGTPWMMRSGTPQAHIMIPQAGDMDKAGTGDSKAM